jgi:RHH-type transcriptional regulator, rel operon repressor / antitoxin RelB
MMATELKDSQVSVRLPIELKDRRETYAQLTGRTKSYVAMEALNEYLAWRTPQIEDLKAAVQAADAGDFASYDEAAAVFAKYSGTRKAKPPTANRRRKVQVLQVWHVARNLPHGGHG